MKLPTIALAAALLTASCSATPSSPPAPKTFTLNGSIKIMNNGRGIDTTRNGQCQGTGGYSDINAGAAVVVQDATGKTLATGALKTGTTNMITTSLPAIGLPAAPFLASCTMLFEVPSVPDGLASYTVTVSHRGARVVPAAEAHASVDLLLQ